MAASLNEQQLLLAALREGLRVDGRGVYDQRRLQLRFGADRGHVEAHLGKTKVLVRTSCEVARPLPERPTDGFVLVNTEFSPMASPAFEAGSGRSLRVRPHTWLRPTDDMVHVGRVLERAVRQSRAVDTEALCIVPGEKVWAVRVDVHVLDDAGNVTDCACVAAMAALHHFRRPDITVAGDDVVIHKVLDRQPVPLSIHHTPLSVSFAFFEAESELVVVDPAQLEEQTMDGEMTIVMNVQREVCAVSKAGGLPLDASQISRCTKIAAVKVAETHEALMAALRDDESRRRAAQT